MYPNRVLFHRTDLTEERLVKCSEHGRVLYPGKCPFSTGLKEGSTNSVLRARKFYSTERAWPPIHQSSVQRMDKFSTQVGLYRFPRRSTTPRIRISRVLNPCTNIPSYPYISQIVLFHEGLYSKLTPQSPEITTWELSCVRHESY